MMTIQEQDHTFNESQNVGLKKRKIIKLDPKKVFIGAGARVLFYPTLLYNVLRYKIQSDFRWWDQVDQFLLLGAVPFPKDVPKLKQLGVGAVITLNEPFETLVEHSLYKAHGMEHVVIPTRDYLYAPSLDDIDRAVDFIHNNASCGRVTYVHCKAGRGRSTTVALCYLVKHKQMTPSSAMELIRSRRPRVLLTSMQVKTVEQFYKSCLPASACCSPMNEDEVLVTKDDLKGYNENSSTTFRKKQPIKKRISSVITSLAVACRSVSVPSRQSKGGK